MTNPNPTENEIYIEGFSPSREVNWPIGAYADKGILTTDQKAEIAHRFDLHLTAINELSTALGHCMDEGSTALYLAKVTESTAIARAEKNLGALQKQVRSFAMASESSVKNLCTFQSLSGDEATKKLKSELETQLSSHLIQLKNIERLIVELFATKDFADIRPDNRKNIVDGRRRVVVETCCYCWQDSGRELGQTTYSGDKTGRGGLLMEFICMVVSMLLGKPEAISRETLHKDVEAFKATVVFRSNCTKAEPEFG